VSARRDLTADTLLGLSVGLLLGLLAFRAPRSAAAPVTVTIHHTTAPEWATEYDTDWREPSQ
jgi:hypothetical protein